ncbi:unnamed protein product [Rhizophagus irregularis]|nr:unnamed protein product [Rhizophagus irregularis]
MESLSDNLKIYLKAFLQLWLQEKGEFQELQVMPTHIVLEVPERIERNLNVARMDEARLSSDRTTLGERVAKDVKKIARRAYELFTARGV